jgi:hypothetical protein
MLPLIGNALEGGMAYLFGNEAGYSGRMYNACHHLAAES